MAKREMGRADDKLRPGDSCARNDEKMVGKSSFL